MSSFLIISIMADDKPGLVETLSSLVQQHQGNWLESRLTHMAGKFAGIVRVQVAAAHKAPLVQSLQQLKQQDWIINIEDSQAEHKAAVHSQLSIIGNDRPGIVKEVSQVLTSLAVNVLELNTQFESAAMSAEPLFKTQADIELPAGLELEAVKEKLENLSNDLMVEYH